MSSGSWTKVIYSPGRHEQIYYNLYNLRRLLSRLARATIVREAEDFVEAELSIRTGFRSFQREFVRLVSEPIDEENLVIHGEGGNIKFAIKLRILGISFATHVEVRLECESRVRNLCNNFASDILDFLEDYIKRPLPVEGPVKIPFKKKLEVKETPEQPTAPIPSPASPSPPPPVVERKEEMPPASVSPLQPQPSAVTAQPIPSATSEKAYEKIASILDFTTIATVLLNASLIARVSFTGSWGRKDLDEIIRGKADLIRGFELVVVSIRGEGEAYLVVDKDGNLIGGIATLGGNIVKGGPGEVEKILGEVGKKPATIRVWGIRGSGLT
ncbi:hypothetical protein ACSU1N_04355 [Thermogladius sp. 4427co]|uniref:hypothetical protein n=1 Tax=Thermogladius sp. 4427co TaxID=3450718 RepID=UPI003F78B14E